MSIQQCAEKQLHFQGLGTRKIVGAFDGGTITSDAGGLLLREVDLRGRILDRFTGCFFDRRESGYAEHPIRQLLAQRVYGLCLGYEDLNDHEQLRYDPLFAAVCGQPDVLGERRRRESDAGKTLAGKSTLQRLESAPAAGDRIGRYHRIFHDPEAIERFFVEHFLDHYNSGRQPGQIIIDLDATDDPIHGNQEGRFFHGFYNCYCYLPLYIFCEGYLLAAKLRESNIDASLGADTELERIVSQIRDRWPKTRIIVRGDSGFVSVKTTPPVACAARSSYFGLHGGWSMSQVEREIRWRELCRNFRDSGMSQKAFCESRGIAPSSFCYWLKKTSAGESAESRSFSMVAVGSVEFNRTTVLRLRLGGEVVAELDLPADHTVIRDVLRAVVSL